MKRRSTKRALRLIFHRCTPTCFPIDTTHQKKYQRLEVAVASRPSSEKTVGAIMKHRQMLAPVLLSFELRR